MNDGRSASLSASSRRHLGHINGAGLTETTAASLRGWGGDVIKTYGAKDLDQHQLWRITMSEHSWGQVPLPKFTE